MSKFKREWRRQQREAWREHLRRHGIEPDAEDMPRDRFGRRERGPFRRYPERGIAGGVIAGLARWLGWSTWAVRGPAIALLVINPPFFLALYLALWALMEREAVFGWVRACSRACRTRCRSPASTTCARAFAASRPGPRGWKSA